MPSKKQPGMLFGIQENYKDSTYHNMLSDTSQSLDYLCKYNTRYEEKDYKEWPAYKKILKCTYGSGQGNYYDVYKYDGVLKHDIKKMYDPTMMNVNYDMNQDYISLNGARITNKQFLEILSSGSPDLIHTLIKTIHDRGAFVYYRSKCISKSNLDEQYRWKIVNDSSDNTNNTSNTNTNFSAFKNYCKSSSQYADSFLSFSKCPLVIPCKRNVKNTDDFGHLKRFMASGSVSFEHKRKLWQRVGKKALELVNNGKTVCISTHGLAVPWLHFRLCSTPIYYGQTIFK